MPEAKILAYLKEIKWPNGFICQCCGHEHSYNSCSFEIPL